MSETFRNSFFTSNSTNLDGGPKPIADFFFLRQINATLLGGGKRWIRMYFWYVNPHHHPTLRCHNFFLPECFRIFYLNVVVPRWNLVQLKPRLSRANTPGDGRDAMRRISAALPHSPASNANFVITVYDPLRSIPCIRRNGI